MRKTIIYTLLFTATSAATVVFSPKPLSAQGPIGIDMGCPCNGACGGSPYFNDCLNGWCSLYCH